MPSPASDAAWLRELAGDLGRTPSSPTRVDVTVARLSRRFGSDVTTYSHLALGPVAHTPVPAIARLTDAIMTQLTRHPLFGPLILGSRDAPSAPLALSDVLSSRQWRSHPIYSEVLGPNGVPLHTVCLPVTSNADGQLRWYQLNRDRDFSVRELDLLTRLQPVLIALTARSVLPPRPPTGPLTQREIELLRHLADGRTVAAVAGELGMALGTARKHLENIHRKLDSHGPVETLRRAIDLGLVDGGSRDLR